MVLYPLCSLTKQNKILNSKITATFHGAIENGLLDMLLILIILVMNVNLINRIKIQKLDLGSILMILKI